MAFTDLSAVTGRIDSLCRDELQQPEEVPSRPETHPLWERLRGLGTELWLDTGSIDDASEHWTREFSALTTNNSLLNKEAQKGTYDGLVSKAANVLEGTGMSDRQRMLEIGFLLNAHHGLRLVDRFGAYVSVEEHTLLAHDVDAAVAFGRRYHAMCPERFIVKVPLTPAGILATRRLSREGIPVNHTLGFSARQNYVVTRIGRPQYVNVFLGRLNAFVADNKLGDGTYVGERATLASQCAVAGLRSSHGVETRQIGASLRGGGQVRDLAGLDVLTMPPKVAGEFLGLDVANEDLADRTGEDYQPPMASGVSPRAVGLHTLWEVDDELVAAVDDLENEDLDGCKPADLVAFFADRDLGDFLVDWTDEQAAVSFAEGKIPKLDNWRDDLAAGRIGLDALMNLAGLNAFMADQQAMDDRIRGLTRTS